MNFEKIYAEFEAAKAADDLERMSDIIAQVHKVCDALAQAGRANEIPQSAFRIARHVYVLLYYVTKLLRGGDVDKAKSYMLALAGNNAANFDTFFYLLYLLGKTFYATGDYSWAAKCFERYEKVRAINFGDVDELTLFYRANCLAELGDFLAAAELYEKILAIKSDFPEAKKNLGAIRGGATKNFSLKVQSLWNFSYWRDVPIFINARDRLGVMKKLIDWLLDAGYRKIFVLDNRSTYPPLLEYYSVLESDSRIKIIRLEKNFGFKALWLSKILERLKISTPYIYTDPDVIPIERCPKDFVKRLMKLLDENREVRKVGLGLVYEDIIFPEKDYIQRTEANLYDGTRVGDDFHFAQVDTTLALYSNVRHYSLRLSLRTAGDLRVYHLPWYFDYDNLPADEKYYLEHADKNSVTSVKNFLT